MAAVLACGPGAVLSHSSAGELFGILPSAKGPIEVSVPTRRSVRQPGVKVYRRSLRATDVTSHRGIPVTTPACTLVDLAQDSRCPRLERAVNEADKLGLITVEALRDALAGFGGRRGVRPLRTALDRHTLALTDSELERRFLPIARTAGLASPRTQQRVNGFRVDFYWPELGLVVETDGWRFHRTPAQQARDRTRPNAHRRGDDAAALHPLSSRLRDCLRQGHAREGRRAAGRNRGPRMNNRCSAQRLMPSRCSGAYRLANDEGPHTAQ